MSCEVHISDYFVQFGVLLYLVEQWNTSVRCGLQAMQQNQDANQHVMQQIENFLPLPGGDADGYATGGSTMRKMMQNS